MTDRKRRARARRRHERGGIGRWAGWLVAALALGALVFAVAHFGDLSRFVEIARAAEPLWLVAAVLLQASTYVSIALGWRTVLVRARAPQPLARLVPIAILKLFVDQVVPAAGIGGNVVLASRLTRLGTPRKAAVAAVLLQASTYVSIALGWRTVLVRARAPQPLARLVPIAILKLFVDQVVPAAGIGGNVVLASRLTRLGTPRKAAVAAVLVSMIGYYAAYALLALGMLASLWALQRATPLAVGLVTCFVLVALAVPALTLWVRRRGSRPLPGWIERLPPVARLLEIVGETPAALLHDRGLIARLTGFNALIFLADVATLAACLCALGMPIRPATAFIAFTAATIVATLGPIPMGLGSFEATSTAALRALGIPLEVAFGATMLLRTLTLWLPMIPGFVLMRQLRRRPRLSRGAPQPR